MKLFFDTNIVLDAVTRRPGSEYSLELLRLAAGEALEGYISASSVTDIYYIARKSFSDDELREILRELMAIFSVAPVDSAICAAAVDSPMADFEDAVLAFCARSAGADCIVTRDAGLLAEQHAPMRALPPADALRLLKESE